MPSRPAPHVRLRLLAAAAVVLGLLLVPVAAAWGSASPTPTPTPTLTPTPTATPTPTPTPTVTPASVTCAVSGTELVYGDAVRVSGVVKPAAAGHEVVIMLAGVRAGSAVTDGAGAYALDLKPGRSGELFAKLADGARSEAVRVTVKPRVSVSYATPVPFADVTLTVKVVPSSYEGSVTAVATHRGATVATVKAATRGGKAVVKLPLRGVGAFAVSLALPASGGYAARAAKVTVQVSDAALKTGSSGPRVKAMLTQLVKLKFRVPSVGTSFTSQVADAVVAFQKAYGLKRDYVFGPTCWRKLETATLIKPKYSSPSTHLEVDKGRQIAMVVKGGAPYGIIAISSGATGNTPSGTFSIFIKSLWAPSNYDSLLFRSMGFYQDFAMHGYDPVPPYPASHGCVREPMWVAQWMYDQSWVGETVYLYN